MWCGRRDSNPRTPARADLESATVGHLVTPAFEINDTTIAVFIINLTVDSYDTLSLKSMQEISRNINSVTYLLSMITNRWS